MICMEKKNKIIFRLLVHIHAQKYMNPEMDFTYSKLLNIFKQVC